MTELLFPDSLLLDPECAHCLRASCAVLVYVPCCKKNIVGPLNTHHPFEHLIVTRPSEHSICVRSTIDLAGTYLDRLPLELRRVVDCVRYSHSSDRSNLRRLLREQDYTIPATIGSWCWEQVRQQVLPLCAGCRKHIFVSLPAQVRPLFPGYPVTVHCVVHGRRFRGCDIISHCPSAFALSSATASERETDSCEPLSKVSRLDSAEESGN